MACVVVNGNPWFRDKDITKWLDYADTKKAIAKNVSEDDRKKIEELMGVWETPLDHNANKCNIYERIKSLLSDLR
ncbi:MAG: Bro-N domain-containing protein [Candidatus Fonsibacter sp.]